MNLIQKETKLKLIFIYAHLPEKIKFLATPPEDITKDKYNDITYLKRVNEMVKELKEKDFDTRKDGVLPYAKEIIINHITSIIKELNRGNKQ